MFEPDAKSHYCRAYEISEGTFISEKDQLGNASGAYAFPEGWFTEKNNVFIDHSDILKNIDFDISKEEKEYVTYNNTALYSPVTYITSSISLAIAKLFSTKMVFMLYIARFINFIISGCIFGIAIKIFPDLTLAISMVSLLPMNIHQAVSLSPDAVLTAVICLYISIILRLRFVEVEISLKWKISIYLLSFILSQFKIVYVIFCLALFLIPQQKFKSKKNYIFHVIVLGILICISTLAWLHISSNFLLDQYSSSGKQIIFMLRNPIEYLIICLRTIITNGFAYVFTFLGCQMGAMSIYNSIPMIAVFTFAIFINLLFCNKKVTVDKFTKIVFGIIIFLIIALVFACEYIQWTPYLNPTINGIQGRYFIPLLLPLLLMLNRNMDMKDEQSKKINFLTYALNLCIVINIFVFYFSLYTN